MLPAAVARSSSDDNAIRYVLLVLWMTSCFHTVARTVRGTGNNDVGTVLKQVVKISSVFTRRRHLFDCVIRYHGSKWCTDDKA